jgi:hypothetical protein
MRAPAAALVALACALATPLHAGALPGTERAFQIPEVGTLRLTLPDACAASLKRSKEDLPQSVEITQSSGEAFNLQMTIFPVPPAKRAEVLGEEGLRSIVQGLWNDVSSRAVEKAMKLVPVGGDRKGFYVGATDRSPGPGEFTYVTQGAITMGEGAVCLFTLLNNGAKSPVIARALEMLRTSRFDGAATSRVASMEKRGELLRIALPGGRGALSFPSRDLTVEIEDDFRPYYFLTNQRSGIAVSFIFEQARACTTSESCRDRSSAMLKAAAPGGRDWRNSRVNDVYLSEYTDPGPEGVALNQRHANAHLVVNGVWIDVHLSKARYQETDRALILDFIQSIRAESSR